MQGQAQHSVVTAIVTFSNGLSQQPLLGRLRSWALMQGVIPLSPLTFLWCLLSIKCHGEVKVAPHKQRYLLGGGPMAGI